jgi:hypothetical protein
VFEQVHANFLADTVHAGCHFCPDGVQGKQLAVDALEAGPSCVVIGLRLLLSKVFLQQRYGVWLDEIVGYY